MQTRAVPTPLTCQIEDTFKNINVFFTVRGLGSCSGEGAGGCSRMQAHQSRGGMPGVEMETASDWKHSFMGQ